MRQQVKAGVNQQSAGPISVVIVDDHVLVAEALGQLLEEIAGFSVVAVAGCASDGLEAVTRHSPDVVLLDVRLPDGNGIELVRRIRREAPGTKVLIVSMSEDPVTVAQAMDAGIHGYVVKTSDSAQLIHAVQTAHEGGLHLDEPARNAYEAWSTNPQGLSDTQADMLRLVAKGLDHKAIADAMSMSISTLKRNLHAVTRKLNADNPVDAAFDAARRGLI